MGSHIQEVSASGWWQRIRRKAAQQRLPFEATIELTYGCNLRCVHCYNPTHTAQGELATEQIKALLNQLAEEGCVQVVFTGGEIFTRRDSVEIFAHAKQKGFVICLFTNATMITPHLADQIKMLEPEKVEVSIYGATQETYERVTGIPGSFPLFLRGIRLLRERRVPLLIKMAVMTLNQHEVEQARALVEGWGIRFVYCTDIHARVDGSREPLQYRLTPQEVVRIDKAIVGHRPWRAEGSKSEPCQAQAGLFTCTCGKNSLAITPHGEMNLCVALPIPKYDLGSGTVAEGWRRMVELVDQANARPGPAYECPSCPLRGDCRQGPMDAWLETGKLEPCLPYFKELATLEKHTQEAERKPDRGE